MSKVRISGRVCVFLNSRSGVFSPGKAKRGGGELTARLIPINVGFHYLSAYREVAAAAGARGTARGETGSARRVHTQNTFPLNRRGTEGVKKRFKKKKKRKKGGEGGREGVRERI